MHLHNNKGRKLYKVNYISAELFLKINAFQGFPEGSGSSLKSMR